MSQRIRGACLFISLLLYCQSLLAQSSSFTIRYASTKRYFTAEKQLTTADESSILVGKWGDREEPADLLVIKVDKSGALIWSKRVAVNLRLYTYNLCEVNDGSIVFVGDIIPSQPPYVSTLLIAKINCKGELLWSKELSKPSAIRLFLDPMSVKPGKDGDVIVSLVNSGFGDNQFMAVCRINSLGNLVWSKTFYSAFNEWGHPSVAFQKGNKVMVFGYKRISSNFRPSTGYAFFAMNLNYENGSLEETNAYSYNEFMTGRILITSNRNHFYAEPLTNGQVALFGIFSGHTQSNAFFYKVILNEDLSVNHAKYLSVPYEIGLTNARLFVFPNGNTNLMSSVHDRQTSYWYAEDNAGQKIREKKAPYPFANSYVDRQFSTVQNGTNQTLRINSIQANSKGYIQLTQSDNATQDVSACAGIDTTFITSQPLPVTPTSFASTINWSTITSNEWISLERADQVFDVPVTKEVICGTPPAAEKPFTLSGETMICNTQQPFTYTFKRKKDQPIKASWSIGPNISQSLTPINDSMVSIKFLSPGSTTQQVKLYAWTGNCQEIKDSLAITLYPEKTLLEDTINFCSTPVPLEAGGGFKSYQWQDGSTNTNYTVDKPGKYWVTVETYCNTRFTDTVWVLSGTTGITTKAAVCVNDTLTLTAPPGFLNYTWGPDYNLNLLTANSVQVFPTKDTSYVVTALTPDGCPLKDTIAIQVNKAKAIGFEKEIVWCLSDQLILDAGSGFSTYLWNTGATSRQLPIQTPGSYWLQAKDANGCLSSDTTTIIGKECPNSLYIPTAFTPNNDGKNDLFKPRITGRITTYELTIYNRWGEIVFKTNQPGKGWDGFYNGRRQTTDSYIWLCTYQFANEKAKQEKGTLTLLQ